MSRSEAHRRLEAVYRAVEEAVKTAGPTCALSGRCCDFPRSGHTLFATALEADRILDLEGTPKEPQEEGWCPYYRQRRCTLRALRPLGCRVYFCDPPYLEGPMREVAERAHGALKRVHVDLDIPYFYAPFLELLRSEGTR
jgi:Fe-S-cluster containining protein